ncbi:MAG: imelysin family protein [Gemmatimonadota bacterium]
MKRWAGVGALAVLMTLGACDEDTPTEVDDGFDFTEIIEAYVDQTVVATYADLETQATALRAAVAAFDGDQSQANLDAAANAWIASREPWEASEGFLFGPVAFLGLDPSLDSWPLDQAQLDDVLASSFDLSPDFIREGLNATLRGFHTVEFLLFRDGQPRTAGDVTDREREYLVAATEVLFEDATLLQEAWTSAVDGVGPRAFADEFRNAGQAGSRYLSQTEAILELIEGMIVIADEVGNGKINDPFTEQDPAIVESWFSWNSLTDFANNVRSIQNAYLGGYHKGTRGTGLNSYVAGEDPALDTRIQAEIQAALDAVGDVPEPFRSNLDANAEINAAIAALNTLVATFENDLKALVRGD